MGASFSKRQTIAVLAEAFAAIGAASEASSQPVNEARPDALIDQIVVAQRSFAQLTRIIQIAPVAPLRVMADPPTDHSSHDCPNRASPVSISVCNSPSS